MYFVRIVISQVLSLVLALPVFAAVSKSGRHALASYDWSVTASPNLAENPPPRELIDNFVDATNGNSTIDKEAGVYVCSFKFADLRRDGFLSLVAGIGIKDRPSCTGITVIDKTNSGFESYGSGGEIGSGVNLASQIRDLHHDGRLEIVLDYGLAVFPQRCAANWTAIYAWTGLNYTNVSSDFKDFYRQRLEFLRKTIPVLKPMPDQLGYQFSDKECLEAEAAAIERFLGSPDAGLDQAIRLSQSEDRLARQFGTILLIQIGSPKARIELEKLSRDPDYGVASYAKYGLSTHVRIAPASFVAGQ